MSLKKKEMSLIILLLIILGAYTVISVESEDIDQVCATDGMVLFRHNGTWKCGLLPQSTIYNVNQTIIYLNGSINGSTNYIPKFGANDSLTNSRIYETLNSTGIGTSNPSATLEVESSVSGSAIPTLKLENTNTGDPLISFNTQATEWGLGLDNSHSDYFKIGLSRELATSNFFTIDTSGNIGIADITPDAKLDIQGTMAVNYAGTTYGESTTLGIPSGGIVMSIRDGDGDDIFRWKVNGTTEEARWEAVGDSSDGYMTFYTDTTEKMRLDNNGNLGIGTNDPDVLLTLDKKSNSSSETLDIQNYYVGKDQQNAAYMTISGTSHVTPSIRRTMIDSYQHDGTNTSLILQGRSNGNTGIGVTDPDEKLEVKGELKVVDNEGIKIWDDLEGSNDYLLLGSTHNYAWIDSWSGDLYMKRQGNNIFAVTATGLYLPNNGMALIGYDVNGGYGIITARKNDTGQVEVARFQGAQDPYLSMGTEQKNRFYSTGDIDLAGGNLTSNTIYGEMWFHNDSAAETIALDEDVWNNITFSMEENGQKTNGFTYSGNQLNTDITGLYKVGYSLTFTGTANNKYHAVTGINGEEQLNTESHGKVGTGTDIIVLTGTGMINLNTGDDLTLMIQNEDSGGDANVVSANINAHRIANTY